MSKKCACCKKILPDSEFSVNKRNKDGLHSYCKKCNAKKAKIYNSTKGKQKALNHSKKQRESGYFRYGHGAFMNMKKSSEKRGISFFLSEEELKNWWFNNDDICAYCGSTIEEYIQLRDFILNYNGINKNILYIKEHVFNKTIYEKIETMTIDRVDSNGPYSTQNMVKACWICNSMKSNKLDEKQAKLFLEKIHIQILEEMKKCAKEN